MVAKTKVTKTSQEVIYRDSNLKAGDKKGGKTRHGPSSNANMAPFHVRGRK